MTKPKPRILTIDIETKPALAYVWGLFDQNIGLNQLVSPSAPICFAAKFSDESVIRFHSDWEDGHVEMIKRAHDYLSEADAVVGYNTDGFDLKKLRGEFVLQGMTPPPPVTSIDLLKTVRKLGIQSNKLAFVGPFFGIGKKVKNEGFELWAKVMDGDAKARKRMEKYCIGDVRLTEKVYNLIRPFVANHPYLGEIGSRECAACGGDGLQSRGYRRTKSFRIQRLCCNTCGSWQDGTRKKV